MWLVAIITLVLFVFDKIGLIIFVIIYLLFMIGTIYLDIVIKKKISSEYIFMKSKAFVSSLVLGFLIAIFTPQAIEAKEVIDEGDPSAVQEVIQNTELESENGEVVQEASKKRNWVKYGSRYSGNNTAKKVTVGSTIAVTIGAITKVPTTMKWGANLANLFYQTGSKKGLLQCSLSAFLLFVS